KHVLCEKPMALSVEECDAMIEASRRAGRTLMIGQCVRFWPGYDLLIDAVRDGRHGRPLSATFRRIGGAPTWSRWFLDASRSGGMIIDLLVHDFDFCRAAFGKPSEVIAHGCIEANRPGSGVDYCQAALRYLDGPASVLVEGGWFTGPKYPFSMTYTVQFENATWGFGIEKDHPVAIYTRDDRVEYPALAEGDGYVQEIRYFLDCLEKGEPPRRCMPEESRDAIAIARAAERSVRERGSAVAL
ncbi:MAG: Gfo/Idh/MocA family oxidoreductase, partial [Planctomycetes bacterium]|nr:Gfo/Idh/MocA family oxidoreductase [Planctomycetota bacterium]